MSRCEFINTFSIGGDMKPNYINPTFFGGVGYFFSKKDIRLIKKCANYANLPWESIASRPETAQDFCERVMDDMRKKQGK